MKLVKTEHTKEDLHKFFSQSPATYLYCIGDLDDSFWPQTKWFSLEEDGQTKAIALLYEGNGTPTLLALQHGDLKHSTELVLSIISSLPGEVHAHLAPGLSTTLKGLKAVKNYGRHLKMNLEIPSVFFNNENIQVLTEADVPVIEKFYAEAYPGNWFDPLMLNKGLYLGYYDKEKLVGVAGTHVYSAQYKAAALGNITTHPDYRGKNISTQLTSNLCYVLQRRKITNIGLNTHQQNAAAIAVYKKVGFEVSGEYDEYLLEKRA